MKKLILTLSLLFIFIISFAQVYYIPISVYYRAQQSSWEWVDLKIERDKMPKVVIYFNESNDALSRIDRITISNSYEDDFQFPYRGVSSGKTITYTVFDNKKRKIKIAIDFSNYDEYGVFDVIVKYDNLEYIYRLYKGEQ